LLSVPDNVTIIEGEVDVGPLEAGEMVISVDTFTLRVDRSVPLSPLPISWLVTYSQGGVTREGELTTVLLPDVLEPPDDPDVPTWLDDVSSKKLSEAPSDASVGSVQAVGARRDSRTSVR